MINRWVAWAELTKSDMRNVACRLLNSTASLFRIIERDPAEAVGRLELAGRDCARRVPEALRMVDGRRSRDHGARIAIRRAG